MFVVFDVAVDGQTAHVSEMSFSLFFTFLNEKDAKTGAEVSHSKSSFR
jgi:hypothetical protein